MSRTEALADLAFIASSQRGYVTRAQAEAAGVEDTQLGRLTRSGVLVRVDHGGYRVAGAPEHPHERLWIAWLRLDPSRFVLDRHQSPHAWLSHAAAAAVWDLGELPDHEIEFVVDRRYQTSRNDVRFHRRSQGLDANEWAIVEDMPVAKPHRVIADLAAAHIDGGHLARIMAEAIDLGHTDVSQLARELGPHAERYGFASGTELVGHLLSVDNSVAVVA